MTKELRTSHILETISKTNKASITTLSEDLSVSTDTIRRDIDALDKLGLVVKVRGGAISPTEDILSFKERLPLYSKAKDIIAVKAQRLLKNGQTIFLDGGTTAVAIAKKISKDIHLTIITNNPEITSCFTQFSNVKLIVLGGLYNLTTQTIVGIQTCKEIEKYNADLYLMGVCAVNTKTGVSADIMEDGEVKQAFMANTKKTIILCTSEKLGKQTFFNVCPLTEIDGALTELNTDDKLLDPLRSLDLEIF